MPVCKLCGGTTFPDSRSQNGCRNCGAKYVAFDVRLREGSLYLDWAKEATLELEATIGRRVFEPGFVDSHQVDGLSDEDLYIVRIRALRQQNAKAAARAAGDE
jgi:hypothetical protein